jgi:hypothetical protein
VGWVREVLGRGVAEAGWVVKEEGVAVGGEAGVREGAGVREEMEG